MPSEVIALHGGGVATGGVVDSEVEGYYAIAASGIGVGVGWGSGGCGGVGVAVPSEVVALHGCGVATAAAVDGEDEVDGAVGTGEVEGVEAVGAAGAADLTFPEEGVAGGEVEGGGGAVADGEMERYGAIAQLRIEK